MVDWMYTFFNILFSTFTVILHCMEASLVALIYLPILQSIVLSVFDNGPESFLKI